MESIEPIIGTFTDTRDGKKYRTAEIGSQIWMAQNLNYRIGQSWCYDNKDSNCAKYGRLYDWNTAMKACPAGWHLPSREEWDKLTNLSDAGTKLKSKSPNWDGMDDFGFSALPAGLRRTDGTFYGVGAMDYWWTATGDEEYDDNAHTILMDAGITDAGGLNVSKKYGYSVRCVQKKTQEETTKQQTTQQQPQPQQTSSSTLTSRSQESIQRTMNGKMVGFQYAYNVRRNNKPDLSGKITVKFAINESGKVIFVQMVESTMNDPEFEKTIVDGIRDFQFEKIGKPNDVQETAFLFNFSPQQQVQAQQQQTGNSALTGGRSRASIQSVVMQHMAALRHAFNRRLRDKPGLSGKIAVKFAINEFGSVISASVVESTMNDPELEKVVVEKVKSFQFEKIDKPGDVTDVTYPFVFSE
jgi:TonB family protein